MDSTDALDRRYLDDDSAMMKVIKGTASGLAAGTIWGTIVATWYDVPRVEGKVALPGLIRTLKMMGNHGLAVAATSGVYIGVEQAMQHFRTKRDFVNGAVGGFVAGASVMGFKTRRIPAALFTGTVLAVTSAIIDAGGLTARVDNGKEDYPYSIKKRPAATDNLS
ncbi:hypothetical protein RND81_14G053600 [Saponaria officinalis]|uniref:Uncharacterized protein n=1 Tax=Saponaria officinalis TaxID=3572 RepID=A0AAW1GLN0_SAPOF